MTGWKAVGNTWTTKRKTIQAVVRQCDDGSDQWMFELLDLRPAKKDEYNSAWWSGPLHHEVVATSDPFESMFVACAAVEQILKR